MARRFVEKLEPCPHCRETPRVVREDIGKRKGWHLRPCCDQVFDLLYSRRPRQFVFQPDRSRPGDYIKAFPRRSAAIAFWSQLMRSQQVRPSSADETEETNDADSAS